MFDVDKIQDTLDNIRANATILRGRSNFEGIDIRVFEFVLLQAFCDMSSCMRMLHTMIAERDKLKAELEQKDRLLQDLAAAQS